MAKYHHKALAEHHADLAAYHQGEHQHHSGMADRHLDHHEEHAAAADYHGGLARRKKRKLRERERPEPVIAGRRSPPRADRRPRSAGSDDVPFSTAARDVDVARTTTNKGKDTNRVGSTRHAPIKNFTRGGYVGDRRTYTGVGSRVEEEVKDFKSGGHVTDRVTYTGAGSNVEDEAEDYAGGGPVGEIAEALIDKIGEHLVERGRRRKAEDEDEDENGEDCDPRTDWGCHD
jgi:hypothetical protein